MNARAKVVSFVSLMWGVAAQAAPVAPKLFPADVPMKAESSAVSVQPKDDAQHSLAARDADAQREVTFEEEEKRGSDAGPYVLLGGGFDGYSAQLGDRLRAGPQAGALVGVKDRILGVEAGYSAGGSDLNVGAGGAGPGFDVIRNSGQAALTVGLSNTPFQPFIMGGGGLDRYRIANGEEQGLQDASNFFAPVGAGVRWNLTRLLTLDARGNYDFLFGENFLPGASGNRYRAQASLGGTF